MITSIWQCMTMINNHQLRDCLVTTRVLFTSSSSSTLSCDFFGLCWNERTSEAWEQELGQGSLEQVVPLSIHPIWLATSTTSSSSSSFAHLQHHLSITIIILVVLLWCAGKKPTRVNCIVKVEQGRRRALYDFLPILSVVVHIHKGQRMRGETATEMFVSHSRRSSPPNEENGMETSLLPQFHKNSHNSDLLCAGLMLRMVGLL